MKFYSHANGCEWQSIYQSDGKHFLLKISMDSAALDKAELYEPVPSDQKETGTIVKLFNLKNKLEWLESDYAQFEFSAIFAPQTIKYPDIRILYNGFLIDPSRIVSADCRLDPVSIIIPDGVIKDMRMRIIEWKIASESRRIFLGDSSEVILGSVPALILAPDFCFSIYLYSDYFRDVYDRGLLELDDLGEPGLLRALEYARRRGTDYFRERQSEKASRLIDELKASGIYPYDEEPANEVEKTKREVFNITAQAVSNYSRDFRKSNNELKKIMLSLIKEAIEHNPNGIGRILKALFDLPKYKQDEFSDLLGYTELGNIISAGTLIKKRVEALECIRGIVHDPKRRRDFRERGHLDFLVRENTWLFGENFHFTLAEAGLTKVVNRIYEDCGSKRKIRTVKTLENKTGRLDIFFARSVPCADAMKKEYIVVELKRPDLIAGTKETDQVDRYRKAILGQPDFMQCDTIWHFYLVVTSFDDSVKDRVNQQDRPSGLLHNFSNVKVWVKTWAEVFREAEARMNFIQKELKISVADEVVEEKIEELRKVASKGPPTSGESALADSPAAS